MTTNPDYNIQPKKLIYLAATLRNEEPFLDEWIIYHKMIGIDHFYLYDDCESLPLEKLVEPYKEYVTVIPWYTGHEDMLGRNRQTKAYEHSIMTFGDGYKWVTFIDGDEFIVLEKHDHLSEFLATFTDAGRIFLNWYVFGHNGYYDDPPGLITSLLTRRMKNPSIRYKSITRINLIEAILSVHRCEVPRGTYTVDANNTPFNADVPNQAPIAHINHYQCRSFLNWMGRVARGNTHTGELDEQWKNDYDQCLKKFVGTVAVDRNEFIDIYMLKYKDYLTTELSRLGRLKI